MKILTKVLLSLALLIILLCIVSVFLPSKVHVERSITINAPSNLVFEQINTLKNWKQWSYWDNIDPNMQSTYEGPESGVGAIHKWSSKHEMVGDGTLIITQSNAPSLVVTDLKFEEMETSTGGWVLTDTTGRTKVTTYMEMKFGFFGRMFPGLFMDKLLGGDFEKTLNGLKTHVEKIASETTVKIEQKTIPATELLIIADSCKLSQLTSTLNNLHRDILKFMSQKKIQAVGSPLAYIISGTDNLIRLEAAIPVNKTIAKAEGNIKPKKMASGNVVVASHYGSYDKLPEVHKQLYKWANAKGKNLTEPSWEVYVTDPSTVKDPSLILTEVYYYVQ